MPHNKPLYDVFMAYSHRDREFVREVTSTLESFDLSVYRDDVAASTTENIEDSIWEALAECYALVVIVSEGEVTSSTALELGAALAWKKPIYAIATSPMADRRQLDLMSIPLYPASRVEEVAQQIKAGRSDLSSVDQGRLIEAYSKIGLPVDQLAYNPHRLSVLVRDFNQSGGPERSGEQLLVALLRLRKRGALPPLRQQSEKLPARRSRS